MSKNELNHNSTVRIKIVGVGGAGNNFVNRMIAALGKKVCFTCIDTEETDIKKSIAMEKMVLPTIVSNFDNMPMPEIGQMGVREKTADIADCLCDQDVVVIIAGMGGSCGTGAATEIAEITQMLLVPTIAIVTKPFRFEGNNRAEIAEKGIADLAKYVDGMVIVPNDNLKSIMKDECTFSNAFSVAADIAVQTVNNIIESLKHHQDMTAALADAVTNLLHKEQLIILTN